MIKTLLWKFKSSHECFWSRWPRFKIFFFFWDKIKQLILKMFMTFLYDFKCSNESFWSLWPRFKIFFSFSHNIFSWPCCAVGSAVTWKVWLSNTKEVKFDTALIIFSFFFVKPKPCNHLSFLRHFGFLPKSAGRQWLFLHTPTRCLISSLGIM